MVSFQESKAINLLLHLGDLGWLVLQFVAVAITELSAPSMVLWAMHNVRRFRAIIPSSN